MNSYRPLIALLFLSLSISLYPQTTHAQTGTCIAAVERAMEIIGNSCGDLARNDACYGNNAIEAAFFDETTPDDVFVLAGDTAPIDAFRYIETSPLNQALEEWGVAVMRLQANLPATLPGQATVFVLFGETQVAEASEQDQRYVPDESVITLVAPMRDLLRDIPSPSARVVREIPAGTEVQVDARSEDGEWLRAIVGEDSGWLRAALFTDSESALSALSVLDLDETFTPMQSFYFTTGVGSADCRETPNLLFVQGPENVTVNLRANGVDIQLGSTLALRTLDGPPRVQLIAVEGAVFTDPFSGDPIEIPPLTFTEAPLGTPTIAPDGTIIQTVIGDWSAPLPITDEMRDTLSVISLIPDDILNYPVPLPPDIQIVTVPDEPVAPPVEVVQQPVFVPDVPIAEPTPVPSPVVDPVVPVVPPPADDNDDDDDDGDDDDGGDDAAPTGADPRAGTSGDVTITEGESATISLIVANGGNQTATDVSASLVNFNTLPAFLDNPTATQGTFDIEEAGIWNIGDLAPGASAVLSVDAIAGFEAVGTYPNIGIGDLTSTSTDINTDNNTSLFTVTIAPPASTDLGVSIVSSDVNPNEGDTITITISVVNNGPQNADNIEVLDNISVLLPDPSLVTVTPPSQGTYGFAAGFWDVGTLANGASATLSFQYTFEPMSGGTTYDAIATINSSTSDPNVANDDDQVSIVVNAPPTVLEVTTNAMGGGSVAADGQCSFAEAIRALNMGASVNECNAGTNTTTILLSDPGPYATGTGDFAGEGGTVNALPLITNNIIIEGNNRVLSRTGGAEFGLMEVSGVGNLVVNDLTFTGGNRSTGTIRSGAAIVANGAVTVNGGVFTNNTAFNDAAIYSPTGNPLTINNSTFTNNTATGGKIIAKVSGNLSISDTVIAQNTTGSFGAVNVVLATAAFNNVTIQNSTTSGATFVESTVTLTGTNFTNNGDVGITVESSNVTVNGGAFTGNGGQGGASFVTTVGSAIAANVTFNGTQFIGNNGSNSAIVTGDGDADTVAPVNVRFANTNIDIGNGMPNCIAIGDGFVDFVNDGGNTGGDGTCFP